MSLLSNAIPLLFYDHTLFGWLMEAMTCRKSLDSAEAGKLVRGKTDYCSWAAGGKCHDGQHTLHRPWSGSDQPIELSQHSTTLVWSHVLMEFGISGRCSTGVRDISSLKVFLGPRLHNAGRVIKTSHFSISLFSYRSKLSPWFQPFGVAQTFIEQFSPAGNKGCLSASYAFITVTPSTSITTLRFTGVLLESLIQVEGIRIHHEALFSHLCVRQRCVCYNPVQYIDWCSCCNTSMCGRCFPPASEVVGSCWRWT